MMLCACSARSFVDDHVTMLIAEGNVAALFIASFFSECQELTFLLVSCNY